MSAEIKVCGVNDVNFAVEAERLGANYLGFIFAEGSPRRVTPDLVREARRRLQGTARCVGVFTAATIEEIIETVRFCGLQAVQLHRRARPQEVESLRAAGLEVWTLAGGAEGDAVLFDSSHGDGETELRKGAFKSVLAGGISAENVGEALARGADVIDVSGSLESSRGVKSIGRLKAFFKALAEVKGKERGKC